MRESVCDAYLVGRFHPVADATDRFDMRAPSSELSPEIDDLDVDGAVGHGVVVAFDFGDDLVARENTSRAFSQKAQNAVFREGQVECIAVELRRVIQRVHNERIVADFVALIL